MVVKVRRMSLRTEWKRDLTHKQETKNNKSMEKYDYDFDHNDLLIGSHVSISFFFFFSSLFVFVFFKRIMITNLCLWIFLSYKIIEKF